MDFSAPFRVISPTLEGPILRALADVQTPLTRSQILALVEDASEAGVRKALARLIEQGIVIEQRFGKRYAYVANREHLLWPSIEGIFSARRLLRERIAEVVARWRYPPASVELFGSLARGGSDASSDIDVLIVRPELNQPAIDFWDEQVADLHDRMVRWTGNACDIVVLAPAELQEARDRDEPILRPPTSNVVGAPLADFLECDASSLAQAAAEMAERTAVHGHLKPVIAQVAAVAALHQRARDSLAAIEASIGPGVSAAHAQLDALRPIVEIDASVLRAAARMADEYEWTGLGSVTQS